MAGKIQWDEEKIAELHRNGYGEGEGASYIPWLHVQHFSSSGRVRRAWSSKTGRTHHLFSDGEAWTFFAAEWCDTVTDIREQYPLDRELTQNVAEQLGIRHPCYVGTKTPMVMTADFLLTETSMGKESLLAINVKADTDLETESAIEKLEIQREYFRSFEIPHHLIIKSHIPRQVIANIESIRDAEVRPEELPEFASRLTSLEPIMLRELSGKQTSETPLNTYCADFDSRFGLDRGVALRIAKILMKKRQIRAPLTSLDLTSEPISSIFADSSEALNLKAS